MDLRYPVGPFRMEESALTKDQRGPLIEQVAQAPARLRDAVAGLSDQQLDTPYRPDGWTARQVVHHLPDSHINAYVRFKLALTEKEPTIRPYEEAEWAKLADSRETPIAVSLALLDSLHERWVVLLRSLSDEDFARPLHHPESGTMSLDKLLGLYAWHGRHHVAHITTLRDREGWN